MFNLAIAHSSFSEFGGAEQVIINQVKGLKKLGHKVTCFTSVTSRESYPEIQAQCYGMEFLSPFVRLLINISFDIMMMSKIANRFQSYDVIISHHHPGPLIAYEVKKKFGNPYIAYVHHLPLFLYPLEDLHNKTLRWGHNGSRFAIETLSKSPGINQWLKVADKRSIAYADAVLTNSHYISRQIHFLYGRKAQICRPGVDTNFFRNLPNDSRLKAFKKRYGLGDNVMLLVARMTPQKKFDWAIKILKSIKKEIKDVQLVIKTEKPNFSRFSQAIFQKMNYLVSQDNTDSIRWIIDLDRKDLPLLYNSAKVYVSTPVKEAFGISPIEAMACGLPVVAWDDSSGTSEYIMNGRNGYLCRSYDLNEFVEKVSCILTNNDEEIKKIGKNAIEYVSKNFNWDLHFNILNSVLSKLVK